MKKLILPFLLLLSFLVNGQSVPDKLQAYFTAAEKAGIFSGSVLVIDKGNVMLNNGYGYKNVEMNMKNDANSIFQIGSVTKQFTAAIILKLAEQGKLKLDNKLSQYFPEFPNAGKITIENLLSHTSGLYNYTNNEEFMQKEVEKSLAREQLFAMVNNKPLDFNPGEKYSYSNTGYMMLGYIIEKVTGKKYEHVVRENIFIPLQMSNTGFDFTHLDNTNKAVGYNLISGGKGMKAMIVDSTVSFAAGAIYSTVSDLDKWNKSLKTEKIIRKQSLQNAFTPRLSKYGLGWIIDSIEGKKIINHNGGIHGFISYNTIFPEENSSITILSNVASANLQNISKAVIAILNDKAYELPKEATEVKVDEKILTQYIGEYELAPTFLINIKVVDGRLMAQATGQPEFELFSKNEKEFYLKVIDAQVEFVRNDKGEVEKLILHQNGQHVPGIKKK